MGLKVLELFSGIGGMHAALNASGVDFEVLAAADINPVANSVYSHNFPNVKCLRKNIESFKGEELLRGVGLLTMSPPCQPFTRNGLKLDLNDARTKPFVSVLRALEGVENPVRFVFVENVKGFEVSEARNLLVGTLRRRGYHVQEFLLCPAQFGIANSRSRYYLLARHGTEMPFDASEAVLEDMPRRFRTEENPDFYRNVADALAPPGSVGDVLLPASTSPESFLADSALLKHSNVLDIVTSSSSRTCCFTKAYGHYLEGTGSVLAENGSEVDSVFASLSSFAPESESEKCDALRSLKLRFFLPEEISRLMCFPRNFGFPDDVTSRQRYRLLGNSVNVFVVAVLLKLLTYDAVELKTR